MGRSTDDGTTWISAPEMPGQQTFNFTNYSGEYRIQQHYLLLLPELVMMDTSIASV
jgi:hypothetical protein